MTSWTHWQTAYARLRSLASARLGAMPRGPTFQPTDVLHEAFVRVLESRRRQLERGDGNSEKPNLGAGQSNEGPERHDEQREVAILAAAIRSVLIDRVRRRVLRARHLIEHAQLQPSRDHPRSSEAGLLCLDDALTKLAAVDERAVRIVELRFFAGLCIEDAATLLGIGTATAEREWRFARAWLAERLGADGLGERSQPSREKPQNPDAAVSS